MLHSAGIACGLNAGDHHRGGAHLHVVLKFHGVVPVQSQQPAFHPDSDIGADLLTGIRKTSLIQGHIRGHQFRRPGGIGQSRYRHRGSEKQRQGQP